jgi:hypothetical protein
LWRLSAAVATFESQINPPPSGGRCLIVWRQNDEEVDQRTQDEVSAQKECAKKIVEERHPGVPTTPFELDTEVRPAEPVSPQY